MEYLSSTYNTQKVMILLKKIRQIIIGQVRIWEFLLSLFIFVINKIVMLTK